MNPHGGNDTRAPWAAPHRVHSSDDAPRALHGDVYVFQQLVIVVFDDGRIELAIVVRGRS